MTSVGIRYNDRKVVDRQKERVHRMTQVIQSFASGFTLRPISVKLVTGGQAPAFSSSDRIWFHEGKIADLTTKRGVASLKGLTLHEISHILLSPRTGTEFRQWVIDSGFHRAWNGLEDQRIEAQVIASYPSIRDWFSATMDEYLLKHPEQWALSFPLIHGRKYLPTKVRQMVQDVFVNQHDVAELASIIDQYRGLNLTDDADIETAKVLVERYHELTKGLRMENPHGHDHRSETEGETNSKSKPWSKKKQSEASDKVKDDDDLYDEVDSDDWDDEDESDEDSTPADGDESDLEDEHESDEDGDSDSDGDESDDFGDDADGDGSEHGNKDTDTNTSDSENEEDTPADGSGDGAGSGLDEEVEQALRELLENSLDSALDRLDDKLANDIDLYNGDVLLEGEAVPEPKRYEYERTMPVSPEAGSASEQFAYELKALRAEYDPSWNNRVANGRINPVRWEQGCEIDEAFDRFDMGREDATDIECVILLDVSGSMGSHERKAHESMWAIKNALDGVNASTSVVAYSDGAYSAFTLYSADERVGTEMRFIPNIHGTDPSKALQYAHSVLANSTRAIRLLIIVTDGEWNSDCLERTEASIRTLRDGGVLTSLAWLSDYNINLNQKNLHGAEVVSLINNPSDLFHLGRSIVEVGIQRQLSR